MSYGTYARRVRNPDHPYGMRYRALRCAVSRYRPLGFNATWDFITSRTGDVRREESALVAALDVLEASRTAWLAELADFTRNPVTDEERRYLYGWRWPGPEAHQATLYTVAALWDEHASRLPLDDPLATITWTYLQHGRLHPGHRELLAGCLQNRSNRVSDKLAELIAYDADPIVRPSEASPPQWTLIGAFPAALADDVRAVIDLLPRAPYSLPASFQAVVGDDRVVIPQRIYHAEITAEGLSPRQRTILDCLFTRHDDGYVRQRHLRQIVGSAEPWVMPFVVGSAGDYVIEIVKDAHAALTDPSRREFYGRFAAANPDLLNLIRQRAASYWSCYHRQEFPLLVDYPGHAITRWQQLG